MVKKIRRGKCDRINNFEILTKLQHYGLGTRLLDVTLNPLVALYFATEYSCEYMKNKNGQYTHQEHDGVVFYRLVNGCSLQDVQIKIALAVPFVEFGKSMSLKQFCLYLRENDVITESEYKRLVDDEYSEIIRILQTNSFIVSANSNVRLIQQRGAFLIAPAVNINPVSETKTSILSKAKMNLEKEFEGRFVVPSKDKNAIREELDFFNVNEATLFPELEHQMRYIQGQLKPSVGTVEEYRQYERRVNTQTPVDFEKAPPDVDGILSKVLPTIKTKEIEHLKMEINAATDVIDWHHKDSVISGLRRALTKSLSDTFSAVDAKSKANQIIDELLA
ncbi:MAG: FRG domain-containing protein [Oscillospiraceae bacterium]|nr:FRG domain-containing protein [Oscillospiraceae bacterium]